MSTNNQHVALDYERFGKVLGMLVAGTDNTIKLAAIGRANAMLEAAGLNWDQFVALSASSQSSVANYGTAARTRPPRRSASSPSAPPRSPMTANSTGAPTENRLSGAAIPTQISGVVSIRGRRRTACGEMIVVDLQSQTGTVYGPLAIYDASLIAALDVAYPGSIAGFVRQPSRSVNLPTLSLDTRVGPRRSVR